MMGQNRHAVLEILDTAGTDQFTAFRELYIRQGHGFLLVFSITSMSSLRELYEIYEEIITQKRDNRFPMVLVGNKADLDDDRVVDKSIGFRLSREWGIPYYETSARRRTNVHEVFAEVTARMMDRDRPVIRETRPRPKCVIL
ncbi:MAG: hypothetical protein Q9165_008089 [Trypethelium subeluteriae]